MSAADQRQHLWERGSADTWATGEQSVSPGAHCLGSDSAPGMLWGLKQWSRETNGKGRGGVPASPWGIVGSESAT